MSLCYLDRFNLSSRGFEMSQMCLFVSCMQMTSLIDTHIEFHVVANLVFPCFENFRGNILNSDIVSLKIFIIEISGC